MSSSPRDASSTFPSYAQYTTGQLLDAFAQGPDRLRTSIAGLTETELRTRARGPKHWSAHEIVLHTTDSELQGSYRFRKIWGQSGCDLPSYDQDAWARELDYLGNTAEDRENALALLAALRRQMTPLLLRATPEIWDRWGVHAEYGKVTLQNVLELYADHTERHIAQILELRRLLGKPADLELLLPERLY